MSQVDRLDVMGHCAAERCRIREAALISEVERLADLTDGLPFQETDTAVQLIERAIRFALDTRGAVEEIERLRGEIAGAVMSMSALGLPKAAETLRSALDVKWGQ